MRKAMAPAVLDLLLLSRGLIDQAKGDKKAALQRAWINTCNHEAAEMLDLDEGRLPQSPRAAIDALLRLSCQLARTHGMSVADIADALNDLADAGALLERVDPDQAIRRGFALFSVLAAQHMAQSLPPDEAVR